MRPICPYCSNKAKRVTGAVIYPHLKKLHNMFYWRCSPCDSHVGCHPKSNHPNGKTGDTPLGVLANSTLRKLRLKCHNLFDPIWRDKKMSRHAAYTNLSNILDIPKKECHFALFDERTCKKVISILEGVC